MNAIFLNNTASQWLITLFLVSLSFVVSQFFYQKLGDGLGRLAKKTNASWLLELVNSLRLPIISTLILTGSYFSIKLLDRPDLIDSILERTSAFLIVMLIIWIVIKLIGVIKKELVLPTLEIRGVSLDKKLFKILNIFGTTVLILWGLAFGLDNAGYGAGLSLLTTMVYGNTIIRWAIVIFLILATIFFIRLMGGGLDRIIGHISTRIKTQMTANKLKKIREVVALIIATSAIAFIIRRLILAENIDKKIDNLFGFIFAVLITWLVVRIYNAMHHDVFVPRADEADETLESHGIFNHQLLPVIKLVITMVVWVLGIIIAMSNAGYNVGAILAGLGVGGLAFALAAQDLVANMYGGVTILLQRPFKIGDRIKVAGVEGRIMEIGLRTTKINDFTGQQLTIPNRNFTDGIVTNVDARGCYYESVQLNLDTEASVDQIKLALKILEQISKEGELIEDLTWASFDKVGEYSFQIQYTYAISLWSIQEKDRFPFPYDKIIAGKTYVNLEIIDRFKANNLKLTFPVHSVAIRSAIEQKPSLFSSSKIDSSDPMFTQYSMVDIKTSD